MYSTCIFCHAGLGTNEAIEHFPVGRRLAFDAARGRLWVVCRSCERWNLTPLEERWEAIEEGERLFSNTKLRGDPHPNTARITVTRNKQEAVVVGSSLGAGRILITSIDGFPVEVTGAYPTLVFVAHDEPGIVAAVSTLLAREGDNIATMRVSRRAKGGQAIHIYELDAPASAGALDAMRAVPAIVMLRSIQRVS